MPPPQSWSIGGRTSQLRRAMTAASLGFAAASVVAPGLLGRMSGVSRRTARLLGLRDVVVAGALLRSGPGGLLARGLSDAGDAIVLARRRPLVATLAAGSAVANLAGALDARRQERRPGA